MASHHAERSHEVMPDFTKLPDDVLGEILARAARAGAAEETSTPDAIMLVCKCFRVALLRCATRALLRNDQQVPSFRHCPALRELHVGGCCTRLPWDDEDPPRGEPHPLAHLPSLTRVHIAPQRFNVEFDVPSLAALRRCPRLRRLHLAFQTTDSAVLRHLLPLTCLQRLFIDVRLPALGFSEPIQSALDRSSFSVLSRLVSLQHLDIPFNLRAAERLDYFSPPAASSLATLTALRHLDIPHLNADRKALKLLSGLKTLEHLNASFYDLNDARMPRLCQFRSLTCLRLCTPRREALTGSGTWHLAGLTGLERLDLNCSFAQGALANLAGLCSLRHLHLRTCTLAAGALGEIGQLDSLEQLCLQDCRGHSWRAASDLCHLTRLTLLHVLCRRDITDAVMADLCGITALRDLKLEGHLSIAEGLAHVSELRALQSLNVRCFPLNDQVMERLSGLTRLTHLDVGPTRGHIPGYLTGKGLQLLSALPDLQVLRLRRCRIVDVNAACGLPALRTLELCGCRGITAATFAALASAWGLEEFALRGWADEELVVDGALSWLSRLTRLHTVALPRATDAGLMCLCSLPLLSRIEVEHSDDITDAGLACLSGLASLKGLVLQQGGPGVTDAGLVSLRGAAHLEYLELHECDEVTEAGLTALADRVLIKCFSSCW